MTIVTKAGRASPMNDQFTLVTWRIIMQPTYIWLASYLQAMISIEVAYEDQCATRGPRWDRGKDRGEED